MPEGGWTTPRTGHPEGVGPRARSGIPRGLDHTQDRAARGGGPHPRPGTGGWTTPKTRHPPGGWTTPKTRHPQGVGCGNGAQLAQRVSQLAAERTPHRPAGTPPQPRRAHTAPARRSPAERTPHPPAAALTQPRHRWSGTSGRWAAAMGRSSPASEAACRRAHLPPFQPAPTTRSPARNSTPHTRQQPRPHRFAHPNPPLCTSEPTAPTPTFPPPAPPHLPAGASWTLGTAYATAPRNSPIKERLT